MGERAATENGKSRELTQSGGPLCIEMDPEWEGAFAEAPPHTVAVDAPRRGPTPRSALDPEELAALAAEGRELGRQRGLAIAALTFVGLALLMGLYLWSNAPSYELDVTLRAAPDEGRLEVDVRVPLDRPAILRLMDQAQRLAPGAPALAHLELPLASLPLGRSRLALELHLADGSLAAERVVVVDRDYTLLRQRPALEQASPELGLVFEPAPGVNLTVDGQPWPPAVGTELVVPMAEALARTSGPDPQVQRDLTVLAQRADGSRKEYLHRIVLPAPAPRLELDEPGPGLLLVSGPHAVFRGRAEPGSKLWVGGQLAALEPDGSFAVQVEVGPEADAPELAPGTEPAELRRALAAAAQRQGVEVELRCEAEHRVPRSLHVDVLRLAPEHAARLAPLMADAGR